jgi:hypothetical protein
MMCPTSRLHTRLPLLAALLALAACNHAVAAKVVRYLGEAMAGGQTVYLERHTVTYDDAGSIRSAETVYEKPDGNPIASLQSDFTASLTVPAHVTTDFRTGEIQGLRRDGDKIVLFIQEKGKPEKTRVLSPEDKADRLLVGCQGLNYYLLGSLNSLDPEQILPLRFLVPGKLDYYDFDMRQVAGPPGGIVEFEIKVKNWFLRFFAPTLHVKYDRKEKHIVWYDGISNLLDDQGKNQKVTITYLYGTE